MALNAAVTFASKLQLLFLGFTILCASEKVAAREVVYLENEASDTVKCVPEDKFDNSLGSTILDDLDSQIGKSTIAPLDNAPLRDVTKVESDGCSLRPQLFGYRQLENATHFRSSDRNPNPVLLSNSFDGLCGLKEISMAHNSLSVIEPEAFKCVDFVVRLNLSHNSIESLPQGLFTCMQHLETLDLGNNRIEVLSWGVFGELISLRVLKLDHNNISTWSDGEIEIQTPLQDSQEKNLKPRPEYCGKKSSERPYKINVTHLDLSFNKRLVITEETFKGLWCLETLLLDGCNFTSMPVELFSNNVDLLDVSLSRNNIQEIDPESLGHLRNLERLDLSHNAIHTLRDGPFINNTQLRYLSLENNKLTEVALEDFQDLSSLQTLNLTSNAIKKIVGSEFFVPTNLKFLGLRNNSLTSLPLAVIEHVVIAKDFKLTLSNNPWSCSCCVLSFKEWLMRHTDHVVDVSDVRCLFQNGSKSGPLKTMENTELCLDISYIISPVSTSASLHTSPNASPTSPDASPTSPDASPTSPDASPTSLDDSPTSPDDSPTLPAAPGTPPAAPGTPSAALPASPVASRTSSSALATSSVTLLLYSVLLFNLFRNLLSNAY